MSNPYKILGVREDAPEEIVESSYRQLAKKYHPDNEGGDKEMFKKIQSAYNSIQNSSDGRDSFDSSSKEGPNSGDSENEQTIFEDFLSSGTPADTTTGTGTPDGVEVDGDYLIATLTGVENRDLRGLVHRSSIDDPSQPVEELVITFEIYNKSDRVLRWSSDHTKVIDSDGYTYEKGHNMMIKDRSLGPRWNAVSVEIEPDARTKFATTFENIPAEAEIEKIVHTLPVFKPDQVSGFIEQYERYVFEINRWPSLPAGIDEK
jgi:hypothetical protein